MTIKTKKQKAAPKSSIHKKTATKTSKSMKRDLACAYGEQCFWARDGKVISNLVELADALEHMDLEVYTHHVTPERNDFAEWIEHVLSDIELAQTVRGAKKPASARTAIIRRLKVYNV